MPRIPQCAHSSLQECFDFERGERGDASRFEKSLQFFVCTSLFRGRSALRKIDFPCPFDDALAFCSSKAKPTEWRHLPNSKKLILSFDDLDGFLAPQHRTRVVNGVTTTMTTTDPKNGEEFPLRLTLRMRKVEQLQHGGISLAFLVLATRKEKRQLTSLPIQ